MRPNSVAHQLVSAATANPQADIPLKGTVPPANNQRTTQRAVPDVSLHLQASARNGLQAPVGAVHDPGRSIGRSESADPSDVVAETVGHLPAKKRPNAACASVDPNRSAK
jgi:hypothetical protein